MKEKSNSNHFSLADALSYGFSTFFKRFLPIFKLACALLSGWLLFILIVGMGNLSNLINISTPFTSLFSFLHIIAILFLFFSFITIIAYIKGMLQIHDNGTIIWNKLLTDINWLKVICGMLIFSMLAIIFTAFFIIPVYIFVIRYYFFPYLLIENFGSIGDCFHEAARMSKGIRWKLFALFLIQSFLDSFIVIVPALTLANVWLYRKIQNKI